MFTGLVEEIGSVKSIQKSSQSARITIKAKTVLEDVKIGDSICTNGVCLTVTTIKDDHFSVDVMPETIRNSSLKSLSIGSTVHYRKRVYCNRWYQFNRCLCR